MVLENKITVFRVHENFFGGEILTFYIMNGLLTTLKSLINEQTRYRIIKSSNTSGLEPHPGLFRMLMLAKS